MRVHNYRTSTTRSLLARFQSSSRAYQHGLSGQPLPGRRPCCPDGYAQVTPRGSMMVLDDSIWRCGSAARARPTPALKDGTKVTVYFRKPKLRESGLLPKGGIVRFYGTAKLHKSGPDARGDLEALIQPEKDRDPEQEGLCGVHERRPCRGSRRRAAESEVADVFRAPAGAPRAWQAREGTIMAWRRPGTDRRRRAGRARRWRSISAGAACRACWSSRATAKSSTPRCSRPASARWSSAGAGASPTRSSTGAFPEDFPFDNVFVTSLNGHELGRIPMPALKDIAPFPTQPRTVRALSAIRLRSDPGACGARLSVGHAALPLPARVVSRRRRRRHRRTWSTRRPASANAVRADISSAATASAARCARRSASRCAACRSSTARST